LPLVYRAFAGYLGNAGYARYRLFLDARSELTPEQLVQRLELNKEFLDIAAAQMEELYQFVAGAGFAVNIADRDGYILPDIGDKPILDERSLGNCCPGYRWTEKDVGTSVISLALEREMPDQINDDKHFCRRVCGHTCSAAPVFDSEDQLKKGSSLLLTLDSTFFIKWGCQDH